MFFQITAQSLAQILPHEDLKKLVPVDLADQGPGVVVVGDIGGVLRENIADDLVDRIVALFLQCLIDRGQDLMDLRVLFHHDTELSGKVVHADTIFLFGWNYYTRFSSNCKGSGQNFEKMAAPIIELHTKRLVV